MLDLKVGGFQLLRGLQVPVMNQHTKFEQNLTVHGLVILGVNKFVLFFLGVGKTDLYEIWDVRGPSLNLLNLKKISDTLLCFETTVSQRPNFALLDTLCKN